MLDAIFRRGNVSNRWSRDLGLALVVDLLTPSLNSIGLGAAVDEFSFLGRSTSKFKTPLEFEDIGVSIDNEDDGTVSGFQIIFNDLESGFSSFPGTVLLNGTVVLPTAIVKELGDPYWRDEDEFEIVRFYEFATYEIQLVQTLKGDLERLIVTNDHLMGDAEQRRAYGVDKPWPPNWAREN